MGNRVTSAWTSSTDIGVGAGSGPGEVAESLSFLRRRVLAGVGTIARRKDAMVSDEIDPRARDEGCQPGHELLGTELGAAGSRFQAVQGGALLGEPTQGCWPRSHARQWTDRPRA